MCSTPRRSAIAVFRNCTPCGYSTSVSHTANLFISRLREIVKGDLENDDANQKVTVQMEGMKNRAPISMSL